METSEPSSKTSLRRYYRRIRRHSCAVVAAQLQDVALQQVPSLLPPHSKLGLYWPLKHEPDLLGLTRVLPQQIALPSVWPSQGLMYLPWSNGQLLNKDSCGVPAPMRGPALKPEQLGLLLVPCLSCTRQGLRLGYGGGWYDRLRAQRSWRAVPALVVLPSACLATCLPEDPWDVPFDGWLDEHGIHIKPRPYCKP